MSAGEGYLKNMQKVLTLRPRHQSFLGLSQESSLNQHLCNNKANLLTRSVPCFHKILGTRPRMTVARGADLVPVNRLLRFARNDDKARGEVAILFFNVLFSNV